MLFAKSTPDAAARDFGKLPDPARALIRAIDADQGGERSQALTQYLASFVHPNILCNLAEMENLPEPDQRAAIAFFEFCLKTGLTLKEQGTILRHIRAHLADMPGIPKLH